MTRRMKPLYERLPQNNIEGSVVVFSKEDIKWAIIDFQKMLGPTLEQVEWGPQIVGARDAGQCSIGNHKLS